MNTPKEVTYRLKVMGVLILFCFGGCLSGALFVKAWPHLPFRSWHLVADPPGKATKILSQKFPDIYVQSSDGNIYACSYKDECEQVEQSQTELSDQQCGSPNAIKPVAPGKVIDSFSYRACGADGYVDVFLIILDDGTIWEWTQGWGGSAEALFLPIFSLGGAILGIIIGIIIHRVKHRKKE